MSGVLHDVTWGALTIKQCTAVELNPGNNIAQGYAGADLSPSALYLLSGDARMRFSSLDVETVVAAVDEIAGLEVASGTITLPIKIRDPGATFVSGSNHAKLNATNGTLIPRTLSVEQGGFASVDLEGVIVAPSGAHTSPISYTGSQSLSAASFNEQYRLGPTTLNGSSITGVTGWTLTYGITEEIESTDGATWPNAVYIVRAVPTLDIRFRTQALLSSYGPLFAAMTGAVVSLVKAAPGSTTVALTEADHITATFTGGIIDSQAISANGTSVFEPTLRLHGTAIVIATGQALA